MKNTISVIHKISAATAFILVFSFFSSSLLVELFGDHQAILLVKTVILYAIVLLIFAMALTGITGAKMAPKAKSGPIGSKKKRMPFIAANGLLILVPAAIYLQHLASTEQFSSLFYTVQAIELIVGAINLTLMSLNIRDGRKLTRSRRVC